MRLEQEIGRLLFIHDCVIVNGFGAFLTQRSNSVLEQNNVLNPPSKRLSFNASLTKNDGLLVQFISENYGLSFDQALEKVNEQVSFWQNRLESGRSLNLEGLGILEMEENKIQFQPENKINYLTSSFGLSPIHVSPILVAKEKSSSWSIGWVAASLVPIILGGFLYFNTPQPIQKFVDNQWSGVLMPLIKGEPAVANNNTNTVESTAPVSDKTNITTVPAKPDVSVSEIVAETPAVVNDEIIFDEDAKSYQVIAAAFRVKKEAVQFRNALNVSSYSDASIIYKRGKYYYVTFKTFDNKDNALEYMREVQKTYPEAWLRSN